MTMPDPDPRGRPRVGADDTASPPAIRTAMVLAAGLGTRLRPLTEHLPKPLVPLLDQPLVDSVVRSLAHAGIEEIGVNSHHLPEALAAHVDATWPATDDGAVPRITLFHEPRLLGTGGALVNARMLLERDACFVVHNGDVVTDLDLRGLLAAHARHDALATLALVDRPPVNTVLLGPDGLVRDLADRLAVTPTTRDRYLTYAGIAVLSRRALRHLPARGAASLVDALVALLREREDAVRGHAPPGVYWNDVGTLERYLEVHRDLIARRARFLERAAALEPRAAAPTGQAAPPAGHAPGVLPPAPGGRPWPAHWPAPARVEGRIARAGEVTVAPGAVLRGFVSLGAQCRVAAGAVLEDCIVLRGTEVGAGARHRRAVVGPDWQVSAERPRPLPEVLARDDAEAVQGCLLAAGFGPGSRLRAVTGHGSDRRFWHLVDGERQAVLLRSHADDVELDRLVAIARFLDGADLGGPSILAADLAARVVVMEDLGDTSLFRLAHAPDAEAAGVPPPGTADLETLYRRTIDLLVAIQTRGTRLAGDGCPEAVDRRLDHEVLRWETAYFREQFLEGLVGMPAAWLTGLEDDFERLARAVEAQPVVLIHRDFQSQNILVRDGRIRLVDVQGMRLGPLAYDPVALLQDAYVELEPPRRAALAEYYREQLASSGGPSLDAAEWHRLATLAGLQRTMQALGAFSYLSRVKGKTVFRRHIPAGLRQLVAGLGALREGDLAPGPLEHLEDVVAELR
ncbi:MAG: sugar phosphate nucleotidyltransferase [Candidatus Eiseniibacteriota bacterium]|jgi:mannose-1-phosphate guanylyltransferase